jgi:hypothetical protein
MRDLIRVNRGDLLGVKRVEINHMLRYLYDKTLENESRIIELEEMNENLADILKTTTETLNQSIQINNLHLEVITGEVFTEQDIED